MHAGHKTFEKAAAASQDEIYYIDHNKSQIT